MQEQKKAGRALDERARRTRTSSANDQVAFLVNGHGAVLDLWWSLRDVDHVGDRTSFLHSSLGLARGVAVTKTTGQFTAKFASSLHVEGLVDGLVA